MKILKAFITCTLASTLYGILCYFSRGYADAFTALGDVMVASCMVFLYKAAKECMREAREEKKAK